MTKGKKTSFSTSFGTAVRQFRAELGLTQDTLANLAAVDRSYMSQIERGVKNVTLRNVHRIAAALKKRPSDLLLRAEDIESLASAKVA